MPTTIRVIGSSLDATLARVHALRAFDLVLRDLKGLVPKMSEDDSVAVILTLEKLRAQFEPCAGQNCKRWFVKVRADRRFCSERCRCTAKTQAYRRRKKDELRRCFVAPVDTSRRTKDWMG
jgi:hypothetical protein